MNLKEYLALGACNGLKVKTKHNLIEYLFGNVSDIYYTESNDESYLINYFKPICFPLSFLTKEIQISDYNNGEPFVPIKELGRIFKLNVIEYCVIEKNINDADFAPANFRHNVVMQLQKWHFAIGLSENEFIPCTDEFNPYK